MKYTSTFTKKIIFFSLWRLDPILCHGVHLMGFAVTLTGHTTLGRIPLDEWSARRRDLYVTTHNIRKRQTSVPPVGVEPKIPASEGSQTHASDSAATGIGLITHLRDIIPSVPVSSTFCTLAMLVKLFKNKT
jgi:hypothetical protein